MKAFNVHPHDVVIRVLFPKDVRLRLQFCKANKICHREPYSGRWIRDCVFLLLHLNYLYSALEGKQTGEITGPMTFGEVAYQLLNQIIVYLTASDLA